MSKRAPVLLLMFDKLLFWNVILILLQVLVQEREVAVIEGSLDEIETFGEEEEELHKEEEEEEVFSEKPIPLWATFDPNEVFQNFFYHFDSDWKRCGLIEKSFLWHSVVFCHQGRQINPKHTLRTYFEQHIKAILCSRVSGYTSSLQVSYLP